MRRTVSILLGTALLVLISLPGRADPTSGAKIFKAKACQACHYTDGPAKEKTIADQLAKKGPELWYAGSKFQKKWLQAWLKKPAPIRFLKFNSLTEKNPGNHPTLSVGDAGAVADFLMSLTSKAVKAGVIKAKKSAKGRLIFTKKMPCTGCHAYPAKKRKYGGGRSGPSLIGAGKRLNPDWIYAYLKNPDVFKPVKAMPTFAGLLRDKDLKNVARFVATFT
jgi:mono/diheme cytochrome c family protein